MWCLLDDGLTENKVLEMGCRVLYINVSQRNIDKDNSRTLVNYDTGEKIIVKDCDLDKYNVLGRFNENNNVFKTYIFISKLGYKLLEYVDLEIIKEKISDTEKSYQDCYCANVHSFWAKDKYGLIWYSNGKYFDLLHILHEFENYLNINLTDYRKLIIYSSALHCKYIITFNSKFNVFFSKARYLTNNFERSSIQ